MGCPYDEIWKNKKVRDANLPEGSGVNMYILYRVARFVSLKLPAACLRMTVCVGHRWYWAGFVN